LRVCGGETPDRAFRQSLVEAALRFCAKLFGPQYAALLGKAKLQPTGREGGREGVSAVAASPPTGLGVGESHFGPVIRPHSMQGPASRCRGGGGCYPLRGSACVM
jgi:hypothetical protein